VRYILIAPDTPESLITAIDAQHWPQHSYQDVLVVKVPGPSGLKYKYIHGDYWPTSQSLNWMGHQVTVVTHGVPSVMTLSGAWRLVGTPVDVTVSDDLGTTTYRITKADTKVIGLPAYATVKVSASSTFVPDRIIHNADERSLSVLISLEPAAGP
jgi:hypothetical protein